MLILFPTSPLRSTGVDDAFKEEYRCATATGGMGVASIESDKMDVGQYSNAIKGFFTGTEETTALYRGWMLKHLEYAGLYYALQDRHVKLINSPVQYRHCHHLPENYSVIKGHTPKTAWFKVSAKELRENFDNIIENIVKNILIPTFGHRPVVLKDYVKSEKDRWYEACYIPRADDPREVKRVVKAFLAYREERFTEGLVFREFTEFELAGPDCSTSFPSAKELRLFYMNNRLIHSGPINCTRELGFSPTEPDMAKFNVVARHVRSNFFTMDVALRTDGRWMIVELGDGGVAGLPDSIPPNAFYRAIKVAQVSE